MTNTLQYDTLNRLTSLGAQSPSGPVASYAYTLGAAGNRTGVTELSGRKVTYAYDNLYRLTSETIAGSLNGSLAYQYDAVGNRKSIASTLPTINTWNYTYDGNDRITGFAAPAYDNDGNTVSTAGFADSYDFENHLTQHGGMTFVYDGDGNRVAKTVGGVTTAFLVDTLNPTGCAQVLDELQAGVVARSYTWGLQQINETQLTAAVPPANPWTTSYYGFDGHGSVRYLTNSTGAVTDTYDYDAFGNLINSTGSTANNYLFAGEQFDPDLGLYYNRARYLDVRAGRFWGMDTWEPNQWDPSTLHRYLYTGDDPVDRVDPSGHDFDLGGLAISMGVSGTLNSIAAIQAHQTLSGVATSFLIGAVQGGAFYIGGAVLGELLSLAGQAASSLQAVQAATQFLQNVTSNVGPLIGGLQLPRYFALSTEAGEVFIKANATKHLEEMLLKAGSAGATEMAAALAVEEVQAAINGVAASGFDAIAGKLVTTQVGSYTVEIVIEAQPGQAIQYAVTHLLFLN